MLRDFRYGVICRFKVSGARKTLIFEYPEEPREQCKIIPVPRIKIVLKHDYWQLYTNLFVLFRWLDYTRIGKKVHNTFIAFKTPLVSG